MSNRDLISQCGAKAHKIAAAMLAAGLVLTAAQTQAQSHTKQRAQLGLTPEQHQQVLNTMQQWQDTHDLPSLSLAISLSGETVFAEAVGVADAETGLSATADTQYSVGSLAKPMTGLALGRLLAQQKASADTRLADLLPEYPQYQKISLYQLASHTAGIGRPWEARNAREFEHPRDHASPFEALDILAGSELVFTPGTDFKYTSMGYVLLSAALARAGEVPYVNLMTKQVFDPLGMTSTTLDTVGAGEGREATYYSGKDGRGEFIAAETRRDRSFLFGGGGYISTPSDLVRMGAAFTNDNYLPVAVREIFYQPAKLADGKVNPQRYTLGWRVNEVEDPRQPGQQVLAIHHGGVTNGASTAFLLIIPEYRAAIAYATNTDPDEFWQVREQAMALLFELHGAGQASPVVSKAHAN